MTGKPMDLSLREWLLLLGALAMALILLHGYYRMRTGDAIRMKLDKRAVGKGGDGREEEPEELREELPTGKGRAAAPREAESTRGPRLAGNFVDSAAEGAAEEGAGPALIVLYVLAKGEPFQGRALADLLEGRGLVFGEMSIFHQFRDGVRDFSLANAVEPGTFDLAAMDSFATPGLTLFMVTGEVRAPLGAFNDMLDLANSIASELGGLVCDQERQPLSPQAAALCRAGIREGRRARLAG